MPVHQYTFEQLLLVISTSNECPSTIFNPLYSFSIFVAYCILGKLLSMSVLQFQLNGNLPRIKLMSTKPILFFRRRELVDFTDQSAWSILSDIQRFFFLFFCWVLFFNTCLMLQLKPNSLYTSWGHFYWGDPCYSFCYGIELSMISYLDASISF